MTRSHTHTHTHTHTYSPYCPHLSSRDTREITALIWTPSVLLRWPTSATRSHYLCLRVYVCVCVMCVCVCVRARVCVLTCGSCCSSMSSATIDKHRSTPITAHKAHAARCRGRRAPCRSLLTLSYPDLGCGTGAQGWSRTQVGVLLLVQGLKHPLKHPWPALREVDLGNGSDSHSRGCAELGGWGA